MHVDTRKQKKHVACCEELLKLYRKERDPFLLNIVTGDESWIHHFDHEEKRQSMECRHASSPSLKKFKAVPSVSEILTKSLPDRIFGSWEYCQFSSVH
jgi:hypothetical protein